MSGFVPQREIYIGKDFLLNSASQDKLAVTGKEQALAVSPAFQMIREKMENIKSAWGKIPENKRTLIEMGMIIPAAAFGFSQGIFLPDLDIQLLGIGWHRFFLFHSAVAPYVSKFILEKYEDVINKKTGSIGGPLLWGLLAGNAIGIGVHLLEDGSFGLLGGEHDVVFGIPDVIRFGSIIPSTYIDDDIFLDGNGLWALTIARDLAKPLIEKIMSKEGKIQA